MKYVALSKFLFIFYVGSSLTWPNHKNYDMIYENGYQVRLSKMSKVCTVIAETCMKCTRLKACFWCGDNGEGQAGCYADNDLIAKRKCYGFKSSYWDEKQCVDVSERSDDGDFYAPPSAPQWSPPPHKDNIKQNVLVKLLLLLTTLKESDGKKKNEIIQVGKQQQQVDKQQVDKMVLPPLPSHQNQNENNRINIHATGGEVVAVTTKNTAVVSNSTSVAINDIDDVERYNDENKSNVLVRVNKDRVLHTLKVTAVTTTSMQNTMENITRYTLKKNTANPFVDKSNQTLVENIPHITTSRSSSSDFVGVRSTSVSSVKPTVKVILSHITFMKELDVCQKRSNCEECVSRSNCYWCDTAESSSSSCSLYPGKSYVKAECKGNIKHKTCSQEIPVFIFALCIILVTFFLSVGYLCARKCYYFQRKPVEVKLEERPILFKQKNGRTVYQITESEEDEEEKLFQVGKDSYTRNKVGAAPNNPAVW